MVHKSTKKLYYVSREVMATSLQSVIKEKGRIYSVVEAVKEQQPVTEIKVKGLIHDKNK